jgi:RNA polymerase sigma factor (sigma-70 family)
MNNTELNDLISRYQQDSKNNDLFDAIYKEIEYPIKCEIRKVVKDEYYNIDDIFQIVVIKINENIDKYQDGTFKGWATRIAHNETINYLKRNQNHKDLVYNDEYILESSIKENNQSKVLTEAIEIIKETLVGEEKELFIRIICNGEKVSDIAREQGLDLQQLYYKEHKMTNKIRKIIAKN